MVHVLSAEVSDIDLDLEREGFSMRVKSCFVRSEYAVRVERRRVEVEGSRVEVEGPAAADEEDEACMVELSTLPSGAS